MFERFFIKICGPTTVENALELVAAGVEVIGLNFYEKSSRYLQPSIARDISAAVQGRARLVGLFVDASKEQILRAVQQYRLDAVQTYEIPWDTIPEGVIHIPAIRIRSAEQLHELKTQVTNASRLPEALLIDSYVVGSQGGTGVCLDWNIFQGFRLEIPWVLAGGLTPKNVGTAIRLAKPNGVDVASGVEIRPGVKDRGRVTAFLEAARTAYHDSEE